MSGQTETRTIKRERVKTAMIDIGSNSVRLVVYEGPRRAPNIIFNEKLLAGLGRDLAATGRIADESIKVAAKALARFQRLCEEMQVASIRCVATAAVRDAENGADLIAKASRIGLTVEILSGNEEARFAALGILSAFPDADGLVGDLGGGSLELAEVKDGNVVRCLSLPLGVLRVAAMADRSVAGLSGVIRDALEKAGWDHISAANFYAVGGSWRSLGRVSMHRAGHPLPVVHGYTIAGEEVAVLAAEVAARTAEKRWSDIPHISRARAENFTDAAALLSAVVELAKPETVHFSAYGLREGLMYGALEREVQGHDPLLVATTEVGGAYARFPEHGRVMQDWIAPIFADDAPAMERLRRAACNLSDVAWRANPDFRSARGLDMALHGNWVAVDGAGREIMGQAIYSCFGGGASAFPGYAGLADEAARSRAAAWGLALRLAQRLSGGTEAVLGQSRLERAGKELRLILHPDVCALQGDVVDKRLKQLAQALGCKGKVVVGE
jgi:exopolyphosphatase / guanosine-5'-triphosphate,3'-diphosphate pyrophosphatase